MGSTMVAFTFKMSSSAEGMPYSKYVVSAGSKAVGTPVKSNVPMSSHVRDKVFVKLLVSSALMTTSKATASCRSGRSDHRDSEARSPTPNKPKKAQKWTDLDKYIELLLDSKSEEETVFLYLNPKKKSNDPYDLEYTSFGDRNK